MEALASLGFVRVERMEEGSIPLERRTDVVVFCLKKALESLNSDLSQTGYSSQIPQLQQMLNDLDPTSPRFPSLIEDLYKDKVRPSFYSLLFLLFFLFIVFRLGLSTNETTAPLCFRPSLQALQPSSLSSYGWLQASQTHSRCFYDCEDSQPRRPLPHLYILTGVSRSIQGTCL